MEIFSRRCRGGTKSTLRRVTIKCVTTWNAVYRDAEGSAALIIETSDGELRTVLRGVIHTGIDFDDLDFVDAELDVDFPVTLVENASPPCDAISRAHLTFGRPHLPHLYFTLHVGHDEVARSHGREGWFENELLDLQERLPQGAYLRTCLKCGLSDYSPYGTMMSGSLACFRDNAEAYRAVNDKQSLFAIWDSNTEFVRETHVCEKFKLRRPGAGYRG